MMTEPHLEKHARSGFAALLLFALVMAPACSSRIDCEHFRNDPPTSAVSITLRNDRSTPIFINPFGLCGDALEVSKQTGDPLELVYGGCYLCEDYEDLINPVCFDGWTCPPLVRIEPGGRYSWQWQPVHFVREQMPARCHAGDVDPFSCARRAAVAPGDYQVVAFAAAALSHCQAENACACEANEDGWCNVSSIASIGPPGLEAVATLSLPASESLELVFNDG